MSFNWRKRYAIKQRFDSEYNWLTEEPGIYLWTREDGDITYFYVGQAKNLKNRRFNYYCIECGLSYPTRHFEASLKKHKDWDFQVLEKCNVEDLDKKEKYWIDYYNSLPNHITRNELIAGNDIVKSNAKRIDKAINKYQSRLKELLKRVSIDINEYHINISYFVNKNNKINKNSKKAFDEIIHWFEDLLKMRMNNKLEEITFDEWIDYISEMCIPNEDWPDIVPEDYGFTIKGGNPYEPT